MDAAVYLQCISLIRSKVICKGSLRYVVRSQKDLAVLSKPLRVHNNCVKCKDRRFRRERFIKWGNMTIKKFVENKPDYSTTCGNYDERLRYISSYSQNSWEYELRLDV